MRKKYGMDTYFIMNAIDMLGNSSIQESVLNFLFIQSSLAVGMLCTKLFNGLFVLNKTNETSSIVDEKEASYILLGYLMYSFML